MSREHAVLEYMPESDAGCLHFLHGQVPGRHLDWILRPARSGMLSPQHISRMSEFIDDIEPLAKCPFTLAIVNLAHGERNPSEFPVGIVVGFRLARFSDDAGRNRVRFYYALTAREGSWSEERYLANVSAVLEALTGSPFGEIKEATRAGALYKSYSEYVRGADERIGQRVVEEIRQIEQSVDSKPTSDRRHYRLATSVDALAVYGRDDTNEAVVRSMCGLASLLSNSDSEWRGIYFGQSGARHCHTVSFSNQECPPSGNTEVNLTVVPNLDRWAEFLKMVRADTEEEKVFGNPYQDEIEPDARSHGPLPRARPSGAEPEPGARWPAADRAGSRTEQLPDAPPAGGCARTRAADDRGDDAGLRVLPATEVLAVVEALSNSIVVLATAVRPLEAAVRSLEAAFLNEIQAKRGGEVNPGGARAESSGEPSQSDEARGKGRGALLRQIFLWAIFFLVLVAIAFWLAIG